MILYYFFYDGQPNSGSGKLISSVKPLKYFKNPVIEFRFKADAVVFDAEVAIFFFRNELPVI